MTFPQREPFDELAEAYDRYRTGYVAEVYDALFAFGVVAGARVLDVGCGTGLATRELAERGCDVVGVDPSEAMIARAASHMPQASFAVAHAEALPFAARSFDAIACAQAFHWFDRPRAFVEFARVVRPGGTVAIWWKNLMRGDATRLLREEVGRKLGFATPPDTGPTPFEELEEASFIDSRLRVVPTAVQLTVAEYLGYERSRASTHRLYGEHSEAYFTGLAQRLGSSESDLALTYVHVLYLCRAGEE